LLSPNQDGVLNEPEHEEDDGSDGGDSGSSEDSESDDDDASDGSNDDGDDQSCCSDDHDHGHADSEDDDEAAVDASENSDDDVSSDDAPNVPMQVDGIIVTEEERNMIQSVQNFMSDSSIPVSERVSDIMLLAFMRKHGENMVFWP
jgi:hypothetical protein